MSKAFIDVYVLDFARDDPNAYANYQKLNAPMFNVSAEPKHNFEASSTTCVFKDLIFTHTKANTIWITATRDALLASANNLASDYLSIFFYLTDSIRIQADTIDVEVKPEQVVFCDLSKPITIHAKSTDVLSINLSRRLLFDLVPNLDNIHAAILAEGPHKEILVTYLKSLEQVAPKMLQIDTNKVVDVLVQLIANCILSLPFSKMKYSTSNTKSSLFEIRQAIDNNIENPELGIDYLIQEFNISRSSLYRLFESLGGITKYIQNRKLDFAFKELIAHRGQKKKSISLVSNKFGFSQPSVFARAFKLRYGISPRNIGVKVTKNEIPPIASEVDLDLDRYKI